MALLCPTLPGTGSVLPAIGSVGPRQAPWSPTGSKGSPEQGQNRPAGDQGASKAPRSLPGTTGEGAGHDGTSGAAHEDGQLRTPPA